MATESNLNKVHVFPNKESYETNKASVGENDLSLVPIDTTTGLLPVGTVIAMAANEAPDGFILCNGAAISRATYAELYAKIGTTYGTGDGSTTFNLPNLTDKFIQGSGTAGTVKSAGLPNITGTINLSRAFFNGADGAFYQHTQHTAGETDAHAYITYNQVTLDASRISSVYGNSTTVQPASVTMRYYIKH